MRFFIYFLYLLFSTSFLFALDFALDIEDNNNGFYEYIDNNDIDTFLLISAGLETAMYSKTGLSYGGGLAFTYGRGISIGLKTAYFFDFENSIDVLELGFQIRFFLQGISSYTGPFIQLSGGQVLFFRRELITIPASWGIIYGGVSMGWLILLGESFFIEPFIRGGYPFLYGGGLSAGIRF
jgi:hypothetical protein